jgi:ABC-2 type transport system permease protein
MLRDTFTKWLWDSRRSILGWALAVAAVGGMYAAFWPSMDQPEMRAALASYPEGILKALNYTDMSGPGYLSATVYGMVVAALLIVHAIMTGVRLVAGDEEQGTLDLVLAHPVGRTRLALQRFAAYAVSVLVLVLGLFVVVQVLVVLTGLEGASVGGILAISLHLYLFAVLFGAVAFAAGAATGSKALAVATATGVAVLGFAANGVLPQVEGLQWARNLSPFWWLTGGSPLVNGVQVGPVLLMAGLVVALVGGGTRAFTRRDIGV